MEPYTLDRNFHKQNIIDGFSSIIWTERYYGDSEVEIVVPPTMEMLKKLSVGMFLGLDQSDEIMILETMNIEDDKLKFTGISLLPWMDNRFVRTSALHEDKYMYLSPETYANSTAGWVLWAIIYYMCVEGSQYLNGVVNTGISNPQSLIIPGLGLIDFDKTGENISVAIPYGPVYKAMKDIATTYEVGMQIVLADVTDTSYSLGFRSYRGLDRSSNQSDNSVVRFSPQMDSFTNIKELQSIAALKTLVYSFAPGLKPADGDPVLTTVPGVSSLAGPEYTGFDLRALMIFADDITTDMVGGSPAALVDILNSRALDGLTTNRFIKAVDGEIVPENQFKYGIHYNLGDVIEVQGNSGVVQTARITEYIRSQDSGGERAYPTVAMIG
jgi:Siphovirus ReqiPepy6 Gp37-like protein